MSKDDLEPQAWVGCLGCYNAGALVGKWVDGTEADEVTVAQLHEDNQGGVRPDEIRKADPFYMGHEELWVMDYEQYGGLLNGECSPMEAAEIARFVAAIEGDGIPVEAVAAWRDYSGNRSNDWSEIEADFTDAYNGEWQSEREFAENLADDIGAMNENAEWPYTCIDWDHATRELMYDYHSSEAPGGGVYIFRS